MKKLIFLLPLFFLMSCSSYVDRLHNQMDQEYREQGDMPPQEVSGNSTPSVELARQQYQRRRPRRQAPRNQRQRRGGNRLSSTSRAHNPPTVKRNYDQSKGGKKRYKADDLKDKGNNASLWASNEGHLFFQEDAIKNGDIILINVMDRLKNEITLELNRAFPAPRKPAKEDGGGEGEGNNEEGGGQQNANNGNQQEKAKIHDRISSVVVEEVNRDHILLRGRKYLLFRNRKRLIEIQALVARRDVNAQDTVASENIIESRINILQ